MLYVGMDISSKDFVIHAVNGKNKKVLETSVEPTRAGLRKMFLELGAEPKLIVMEAGNQMKWIAMELKKREDVTLHVVHPNEIKWITCSGGKKTDKVDAKKLAILARSGNLPKAVHIVEGSVRELRELLSARDLLQKKRIGLGNSLRGQLKQEGIKLPERFFARKDWQDDIGELKLCKVQQLIARQIMTSIESLKASEDELTEAILKIEDDRLKWLESIPGIGGLSSRVLLSAIDNAERFESKKHVANYGALTPTIYQSGNETHMGRINRDGRQEVRKAMLQCAHAVCRTKDEAAKPLKEFYARIEKRRGKKRAVVALARKLLTTSYGVMKGKEFYDPRKLYGYAKEKAA